MGADALPLTDSEEVGVCVNRMGDGWGRAKDA